METRLKTEWKSDIETAIAPAKKQIEDAVASITNEYTNAISSAKTEVTEAYRAEMKVEISKLEESLKSWVNGKFESYWTISETQAKLDAQKTDLETQLKAQKEYLEGLINNLKPGASESENRILIDNLTKELESVKKAASDNASAINSLRSDLTAATESVTKAYKDAIAAAINEYDGKIDSKIDSKISELNSSIDSKVAEINNKIAALDSRVKTLEDSVSDIKSQISALQDEFNALKAKLSAIIGKMVSISYIPTYEDGVENVPCTMSGSTIVPGSFTMRFEVQPASLAEDLAASWNTALSVKAVYTKTRTRASAGDFIALPVESATASDGILSVTVSGASLDNDAFVHRNNPVSARLKISDGTNEVASEYVKLTPIGADYIDKNGVSFGPGIVIDNTIWSPANCGATKSDLRGEYYNYAESLNACPEGWRTPTIDEFKALAANHSSNTDMGNDNGSGRLGVYFSGSKPYREAIIAVFFPCCGERYKPYNYKPYNKDYMIETDYIVFRSSTLSSPNNPYIFQYDYKSRGINESTFNQTSTATIKIAVRCVKE